MSKLNDLDKVWRGTAGIRHVADALATMKTGNMQPFFLVSFHEFSGGLTGYVVRHKPEESYYDSEVRNSFNICVFNEQETYRLRYEFNIREGCESRKRRSSEHEIRATEDDVVLSLKQWAAKQMDLGYADLDSKISHYSPNAFPVPKYVAKWHEDIKAYKFCCSRMSILNPLLDVLESVDPDDNGRRFIVEINDQTFRTFVSVAYQSEREDRDYRYFKQSLWDRKVNIAVYPDKVTFSLDYDNDEMYVCDYNAFKAKNQEYTTDSTSTICHRLVAWARKHNPNFSASIISRSSVPTVRPAYLVP